MSQSCYFLLGKRRYDRKQSGYGGQTKVIFRKKVCDTKCFLSIILLHCSKTSGPGVIKLFSCSTQLSIKFSLLINMNSWHFRIYELAEKISCTAVFNKKELAIANGFPRVNNTSFFCRKLATAYEVLSYQIQKHGLSHLSSAMRKITVKLSDKQSYL